MIRLPIALFIVVAASTATAASQQGGTSVFVWPAKTTTWLPPQPKEDAYAAMRREDGIAAAKAARREEERIERIIVLERTREKSRRLPAVDPEKDMYRKFLERRELEKEPEYQAILDQHPESRPRNDYAEWKKRQPEPAPRNAREPAGKPLDWGKWLQATREADPRPVPVAPKPNAAGPQDE